MSGLSYNQYNSLLNKNTGVNANDQPAHSFAPLEWNTGDGVHGSMDNLYINSGKTHRWLFRDDVQKTTPAVFASQGHGVPLAHESRPSELPSDTDALFYLQRNRASKTSGPSTFTTSTGFVPLTYNQITHLGARRAGNN